jgi:NAD(P)-dependent dehydrogenase (short-subunit alcohol dehydrogenase family)
MPTLAVAEASNAAFSPGYIPVAVFAGGTSGVGQAMAEAFARQTNGRAYIILIGQNAAAASAIIATFPKPAESDGWMHEFVQCDATSMAGIRALCAGLRVRLERINFLLLTAAGPKANSLLECGETAEGLDNHLAMRYVGPCTNVYSKMNYLLRRYFARYVYTKELLPLLLNAREQGQHAHVMTILGAGLGFKIPSDDLGLDEARRRTIKILQGAVIVRSLTSVRHMALITVTSVRRRIQGHDARGSVQRRAHSGGCWHNISVPVVF